MKKRGVLFIVLLLAVACACTLSACGEPDNGSTGSVTPVKLAFNTEYASSSSLNPVYLAGEGADVSDGDFSFSKIKFAVEYSDGTKGTEVVASESMLTSTSTGNYIDGTGYQSLEFQYTTSKGEKVTGTIRIYFRLRTGADYSTLTIITNGGTPNTFTKKVVKGTEYTSFTAFNSSFAAVTKARYTLLGWVIMPQDYDYSTKSAEEIENKANALASVNLYSPTAWPTDITIQRDMAFCAVWQENTTSVTFNYNFSKFGITQDLYSGSGLPSTPQTSLYAPSATLNRPTIADNAIPGWKFVGWFTDEALTSVRSFNQPVGGIDFTLYAKWEQVLYSVSLNLVGGTLNPDYYIVDENDKVYEKKQASQTATPTILRGEVTKKDSTSSVPTRITYTNISYKKQFNPSSGSIYYYLAKPASSIDIAHYLYKGSYHDDVTGTDSYYYNFLGWYEDANYTVPYNFTASSTMPARDLVLYAKWDINAEIATEYYENYLFKDKYIVKPDGTIKITGVNDKNIEKIALPNSINGKFITEIGDEAFSGCTLLTTFTINQTSQLTTIGSNAFHFCSKLTNVSVVRTDSVVDDISKTQVTLKVNSVGKDAFRGTTWLSNHTNEWITIGSVLVMFKGSNSVQKIVPTVSDIPLNERDGEGTDDVNYVVYGDKLKNVSTISANAFKGLTKLATIIIPNSIVTIEDEAFVGCSLLSSITVQQKSGGGYALESVGGSALSETAWYKYPSATDANFAQYNALILGSIYYRFAGSRNTATTMATVPDGITIIAPGAFQDYDNIRSVEFSNKTAIKSIGKNAFNDTAWFTAQGNANDGFIIVNGILVGYIGKGVSVTSGDTTIKAVYIPATDADGVKVTTIATNAFYGYYNSTIQAISMPETISSIESYAFRGATALKTLSYLGSAKPHSFAGVDNITNSLPKITESSFYGATSGVLVNTSLVLYLTTDTNGSGNSLYSLARVDDSANLYFKLYSANNEFLKTLINNGIKVKDGTLASRYVKSPGWTLSSEWEATGAFDLASENPATLVLLRTDGLPYETPLLKSYINALTISSELTTDLTPHSLSITYGSFSCTFDYYVEPKISSISIDNGAASESLMSKSVYFTTSKRFVYSGGSLIVNFEDAGVTPLTIPLTDAVVGANKLVQITGFSVIKAGTFNLTFTYTAGLQSVNCTYSYEVKDPKDVNIEFYEPLELEINSTPELSDVILKIIRNDPKDGGQIFDVGSQGYYFTYVTMKNAKVKITKIDGVAADAFNTSVQGTHTVTVKYGSDSLGYTNEINLEYTVVLKTLDSWFTYDVLSTSDVIWNTVDGVDYYLGTAKITKIQSGHLPTIVIPSSFEKEINGKKYHLEVIEIGESVFLNDLELVTVYIASTVQKVGNMAFKGCANLVNVYFMLGEADAPSLTSSIGSQAFDGCAKLTTIALPAALRTIGTYAFSNSGLTSIDLSGTQVSEISDFAFEYCTALTTVTLSATQTVIGNSCFYGCKLLNNVALGSDVTYIGTYAFYYCDALTALSISATTAPTIGAYAFGVQKTNLAISVPAASVTAYQTAWTYYSTNVVSA